MRERCVASPPIWFWDGHLLPVSLHIVFPLCLWPTFLFHKETSLIGSGPTLRNLILSWSPLCRLPIQIRSHSKGLGVRTSYEHMNIGTVSLKQSSSWKGTCNKLQTGDSGKLCHRGTGRKQLKMAKDSDVNAYGWEQSKWLAEQPQGEPAGWQSQMNRHLTLSSMFF